MAIDINTAYELWQFDVLTSFNDKTQLVINRKTKHLMIKKIMSEEEFDIHQKLTGINHPNIIRVYDVIRERHICTVLEQYVAGQTLEQLCSEKPLSEKETKNIILQICRGLQILHQNNIIHRDLTPSNIMISDDGTVKIIDFDISRSVNNTAVRDTTILGTEGFAAPEQFGFGQSNAQTDIYALGVLINYMLTGGKLPNEQMYSGRMSKIIKRCTEFNPEKRYKSVDDIARVMQGRTPSDYTIVDKIFDSLPGLRNPKISVKIFSTFLYMIAIGIIYMIYAAFGKNMNAVIYLTENIFLLFVIPFVCFSDFLQFQERLPYLRKIKKPTKRFIFGFLAVICIISGIFMLPGVYYALH
ncbi:MAG: serine/threonine-protein kinase [Clostridia bacterium]|nr:serine/threonine-protein kinase [Clostridia bacterium]